MDEVLAARYFVKSFDKSDFRFHALSAQKIDDQIFFAPPPLSTLVKSSQAKLS